MSRNLSIPCILTLALSISLAVGGPCARGQEQPAPSSVNPEKMAQPAQNDGKSPEPAPQPAGANDAPKAAAKPRHVITNEDIEAQHAQMASANSDIDIGNINDCDNNCFDSLRYSTGYYVARNTDWKHDLLRGIQQVTDDSKWQAALYQIARLKAKFCELSQDKNDALADSANPKNMTEDEIAIQESYERKFEAAENSLNAAYSNADAIMRGYSGIVVGFMNLQKQRAGNRGCVIRYPMTYRGYRAPVDDPDRP